MQILSTISAGTLPGMFTEGGAKWAKIWLNRSTNCYGDMF